MSGHMREAFVAGTGVPASAKFLDRGRRSLAEEAVSGAPPDASTDAERVEAVYFANASARQLRVADPSTSLMCSPIDSAVLRARGPNETNDSAGNEEVGMNAVDQSKQAATVATTVTDLPGTERPWDGSPAFGRPILLRTEHAHLRVPDPSKVADWYVHVLGLAERGRDQNAIYLGCGAEDKHDLVLVPGDAALHAVGFGVDNEDHLEQIESHLEALGVGSERRSDPEPGITRSLRSPLPTGHNVDILLRKQRKGYLVATEGDPAGALAPTEFNHVTFGTSKPGALHRYLAEVLGFRTSDLLFSPEGEVVAAFMRVSDNHHDIAILMGPKNGLHHFAFNVADVGQLVSFADRVTRMGYRPETGIGRHGPGNNIYLYVKDPAGHRVELSTQIARVSDRDAPPREWRVPLSEIFNMWAVGLPPEDFFTSIT